MGEFSTVPSSSRWCEAFLLREEGHVFCAYVFRRAREICVMLSLGKFKTFVCDASEKIVARGKRDETHLANDVSSFWEGKRNA